MYVTYQLLQIPPADLHVAAVLVHALGELRSRALAVARGVPLVVVLLGGCGLGLRRGSGLGGAAGEEAADGVADGGTDCDTTGTEALALRFS